MKPDTMPDVLTLNSLPLFPLSAVLFPRGLLPLQVFEVRYLDMIRKCYKAGAPFGVVSLTEGSEVQKPATAPPAAGNYFAPEAFSPVGTLARITALDDSQPGLLMIQCEGLERFEITHQEKLKHGLWIANVTQLPADMPVVPPSDLQKAAQALSKVIVSLELRELPKGHKPMLTPYRLDDCGWVANRWCELLPMPVELKQRLMALDNPLLRLELVCDILRRTGIAL